MITLQKIQEYRDHPNYSQTDLKNLLYGKGRFKPSLVQLLGSYLDVSLLTPYLKDEVYIIQDIKRPTENIVKLSSSLKQWIISQTMFQTDESEVEIDSDLESYLSVIVDWIETVDYYNNRPKTRVKTFVDEAKDWWQAMILKGNKEIITSVEELETDLMVMRLKSDPELDWLWQGEFQKDFYWDEMGIGCKGLGDICVGETYVDLKYTECNSLEEWMKICAKLNYPFQMAFYQSGLGKAKDWRIIRNCKWLVVNKNWHQLVNCSELMLNVGKYGYTKNETMHINGGEHQFSKHIPGYIDALRLIQQEQVDKDHEQIYIECLLG